MRVCAYLLLFILLSGCWHKSALQLQVGPPPSQPIVQKLDAYFTPDHKGQVSAFDRTYEEIDKAKSELLITLYSWGQKRLKDSLEEAIKRGVRIKVVLHRNVYRRQKNAIHQLEELGSHYRGCFFKIAPKQMHEKFIIIDRNLVINTSANMSYGAQNRYSENFIFFDGYPNVTKAFVKEFEILFNSSSDIVSDGDEKAPQMKNHFSNRPKVDGPIDFYSSSINFNIYPTKENSKRFANGKFIKLIKRKHAEGEHAREVEKMIINKIKGAKYSIYCNLNHLFLKSIRLALVQAYKRGVDVKLMVDNQEYKDHASHKIREQTPHYIKDLIGPYPKAFESVRVKYYSHYPGPKNWQLNHHKYILIDYKGSLTSSSSLISGSHNLSKTAEHSQFDNMVVFDGSDFHQLYESFFQEFELMWFQNRDENDRPIDSIVKQFLEINKKDSINIHVNHPIALNWKEVKELREWIQAIIWESRLYLNEPLRFKGPFKILRQSNRDCQYYHIPSDSLRGCPNN